MAPRKMQMNLPRDQLEVHLAEDLDVPPFHDLCAYESKCSMQQGQPRIAWDYGTSGVLVTSQRTHEIRSVSTTGALMCARDAI